MNLDEFVSTLKKVPRCVFISGNSNPPMNIPFPVVTPTIHPRFITTYGEKRFTWMFEDPDEKINYKGTVRWKDAVFLGAHSALIQYAFPYAVKLPFVYDSDNGMTRFLNDRIPAIVSAGIGPFFVHNTLVRNGRLQPPIPKVDAMKEIDLIAFPDEVSAIIAAGLLNPSIRQANKDRP